MVTDEGELLHRWAAGDRDSGERLIRRHFAAVYRVFAGKLPIAIDDLVQETFLACVEQRDRLDRVSSFRGFVLGIARHKLYACFRSRLKQPAAFDPQRSTVQELLAVTGGYSQGVEHTRLHEALVKLPIESQLLLQLRYFEDLDSQELGDAFGCKPTTIRSRLLAARKSLKAVLAEAGERDDAVDRLLGPLEEGP